MPRRRFSTGGDEESWSHSLQRVRASLFSFFFQHLGKKKKKATSINKLSISCDMVSILSCICSLMSLTHTSVFSSTFCPSQIGSGIGRMILKEEMKARSGSYDNDPWGSARNSRSGSKETLNTTSYGTPVYNNTINGCKDPACTVHICICRLFCHWSTLIFLVVL